MNFLYFLLLIFCIGSIYPTIIPYQIYLKDKLWWSRTWSPHALVVTSIALLFLLTNESNGILNVVSGTLMIVSGFGLLFIIVLNLIENRKLLFLPPIRSIVIVIHHSIMGLVGFWLLFASALEKVEFLWAVGLLTGYAAFIFPKGFDVPFILYKKSFIPIKTRRLILQLLTGIIFILIPFLRLSS